MEIDVMKWDEDRESTGTSRLGCEKYQTCHVGGEDLISPEMRHVSVSQPRCNAVKHYEKTKWEFSAETAAESSSPVLVPTTTMSLRSTNPKKMPSKLRYSLLIFFLPNFSANTFSPKPGSRRRYEMRCY